MRRCLPALIGLALLGCGAPADPDAGAEAGPEADAGAPHTPRPFTPTEATRAYCPGDDDAIEARITAILRELSVEEKVRLMAGAGLELVDGTWGVPGDGARGLPGLHMLDGPRGLSRFSGKRGTAFPVAMMRGATWDPELERRVGAAIAIEARSAGADVLLAPTINVLRHPRWGRAQETYSEDPHHMAELAVAFVEGVQAEGVLASAKHLAANSIEDTRHAVSVELDERTLREVYLPHFRRVVQEAHVASVMSAYNRVNGLYCDLNPHLLRDILKDEWGFAGFVESDWILGTHGDGESVRAGLDLEMPSNANFRFMRRALLAGEITEHDLDDAVRRIARAQLCYGLDARPRTLDEPGMRETPAHLALAREAARRGAVLLENAALPGGGDALPLDRATVGAVVVVGRNAAVENIGDDGSSSVTPTEVVTALEGLEAAAAPALVTHLPGDRVAPANEAAVRAAGAVIVVTGLTKDDEGEGEIGAGDRDTLALPASERALIAQVASLNDRVIVVLEGGAAILVEDFVDDVEAILMAFYPGAQGGHAIAELIFGDAAPSGRLPFSWPAREADLPAFDNTSSIVAYGYLHGYRHLEANGTAPRYPFGYGLGYTTFTVGSLALARPVVGPDDTVEATVEVVNTGARAGRATVQAYARAIGSAVERAPRDLRAFAQVELGPAETATVTLGFPARDLAIYDEAAGAWVVEAIDYELAVGTSALDLPLTATFSASE